MDEERNMATIKGFNKKGNKLVGARELLRVKGEGEGRNLRGALQLVNEFSLEDSDIRMDVYPEHRRSLEAVGFIFEEPESNA
jgi:hypothetical protein